MTDLNKGLFVVNKLNPFNLPTGKRYCRIVGASIYSVDKKIKPRLVAYKVGYWDEEPKTESDFSNIILYRSSSHGMIVHVFETDTIPYTHDELIRLCNKHFIEKALTEYKPLLLNDELIKLTSVEHLTHVAAAKKQTGRIVKVWDIQHKALYLSTNGLYPLLEENKLRYKGNFYNGIEPCYQWNFENNYITVNTNWKQPLHDVAIGNLELSTTIDYCNQHFLG